MSYKIFIWIIYKYSVLIWYLCKPFWLIKFITSIFFLLIKLVFFSIALCPLYIPILTKTYDFYYNIPFYLDFISNNLSTPSNFKYKDFSLCPADWPLSKEALAHKTLLLPKDDFLSSIQNQLSFHKLVPNLIVYVIPAIIFFGSTLVFMHQPYRPYNNCGYIENVHSFYTGVLTGVISTTCSKVVAYCFPGYYVHFCVKPAENNTILPDVLNSLNSESLALIQLTFTKQLELEVQMNFFSDLLAICI